MRLEDRIRGAFDCVKAQEGLKTSTKEFLGEVRQREGVNSRRGQGGLLSSGRIHGLSFRWAFAAACAMLTVVLCMGSYALLWMPVAYVSIDVNPSLELELNRLDRVIAVRAYNEDGGTIVESISVRGMRYEDAIERIVDSEGIQPYLTSDADLTFTIAADSGQKEERLLAYIARSSGCTEHGGIGVRADMSLVGEAHENGFSLGKYLVYQLLLRHDPSVTAQDCHDMSMSQLHGMLEEHEHERNHGSGQEMEHEGNYGNGLGTGQEVEDTVKYEIEDENNRQTDGQGEGDRHEEKSHSHKSDHGLR